MKHAVNFGSHGWEYEDESSRIEKGDVSDSHLVICKGYLIFLKLQYKALDKESAERRAVLVLLELRIRNRSTQRQSLSCKTKTLMLSTRLQSGTGDEWQTA